MGLGIGQAVLCERVMRFFAPNVAKKMIACKQIAIYILLFKKFVYLYNDAFGQQVAFKRIK